MTNHDTIHHDGQIVDTEHGRRERRAARRTDRATRRFGRFRSAGGDKPPDKWQGSADIGHARARITVTSL